MDTPHQPADNPVAEPTSVVSDASSADSDGILADTPNQEPNGDAPDQAQTEKPSLVGRKSQRRGGSKTEASPTKEPPPKRKRLPPKDKREPTMAEWLKDIAFTVQHDRLQTHAAMACKINGKDSRALKRQLLSYFSKESNLDGEAYVPEVAMTLGEVAFFHRLFYKKGNSSTF